MPGRRVIVHAGFHKTGTTSAQAYLKANGKYIYPRCALVLPRRLRKGAARMAMRYSRFGTDGLLDQFGADLREVLTNIDHKDRTILVSDENLAGQMPGRDGHPDYSATPVLMERAEDVICDIFGAETDVVFHFTTRAPDSWLRSTYRHNLRQTRLTMDEAEYMQTYAKAADLDSITQAVAHKITGTVYTIDLADLTDDESPARPLIDLIGLPAHLRTRLKPHPPENIGPDKGLIVGLLTLNRSDLDDTALKAAKADLLGKANDNDG